MAKKRAPKSSTDKKSSKKPAKRPIEQYDHADEQRANNPPVGLVTPENDPEAPRQKYQYDPHLDPQLVWAGKAEHTAFEVPTVSLHVHERIDPKTIIQAVRRRNGNGSRPPLPPGEGRGEGSSPRQQTFLFEQPTENPPIRDAVEFYQHEHNWSNRLVAGDSLLVMNSLLEKEGLAGKVQMIYLDPPYGIRYGSNFQPFVNRRDVKDGRDEDLTQEPETIRAFRDTWELGIHSYLTYLRDRLLLARELLHESGSIFVQISDENLHHVRELMDEIFGAENFCSLITFRKKLMPLGSDVTEAVCDYILWYCRQRKLVKSRPLFREKEAIGDLSWSWAEFPNGERRRLTRDEIYDHSLMPKNTRMFQSVSLLPAQYRPNQDFEFQFQDQSYPPPKRVSWKTDRSGMDALAAANRLIPSGETLRYVLFHDDYPVSRITSLWADTVGADDIAYVVQTNTRVIQRCVLMTTDPGDLVFDPTCGSGTTAYVAEQWGRRWITCDTSRVALTLAKQRLMTASFDYYQLAHPEPTHKTLSRSLTLGEGPGEGGRKLPSPGPGEGPGEASGGVRNGFVYKTVPHVTLKSIANNPEIKPGLTRAAIDAAIAKYADQETLYDQPLVDKSKARVTGPFTVEAVPAVGVLPLHSLNPLPPGEGGELSSRVRGFSTSVARRGETVRQAEWRDELLKTGIRGRSGQRIEFSRVETLGGTRWLHADAETEGSGSFSSDHSPSPKTSMEKVPDPLAPLRAVISFGPEHAPLEQKQVARALDEAETLRPKPKLVIFAAFQFDPEAAKDVDETNWPGVTLLKAQMNADLLTDDLKTKRTSNDSYWLIGQPDVGVRKVSERAGSSSTPADRGGGPPGSLYQVTIHGFDYYNTRTGAIESGDTTKIAMWLLDTDYDGRSLYPRQVFFPMSGEKDGWSRLAKNLKAEIDEDLIEEYRGTQSLPFAAGEHNRVAVKIVDDRGIESLRIVVLENP